MFSVENERTVKDNHTYNCFVCSWKTEAEELVNLLNSLSEENKRLIGKRGELETKNVILKKENEQLKKRNKFLREFDGRLKTVANLNEENEQLKQELQGMAELLQSYRKTIKHDAELLANASKNGYLPPLNDFVSADGWNCGCCKHFHSGVRDRYDKDNNWVLNNGYCQDFER